MTTAKTFTSDLLSELVDYEGFVPLGRGGFAQVYAARRRSDGMEVAIKVASRRADPRFVREEAALRRITPDVSPVLLASGKTASLHPYIVMSRLHGPAFGEWHHGKRPSMPEKFRMGAALARIVDVMHGAGIIHRDLKPDNVLVVQSPNAADYVPRIIDFGLARFVDDGSEASPEMVTVTAEGSQIGTILYMAPEQCEGKKVDIAADIYSLGVILFELMVGRTPFDGDALRVIQAHATRKPPVPSRLVDKLPASIDDIILRCLAKRPGDRPARANIIADSLEAAALEYGKVRTIQSEPRPQSIEPRTAVPPVTVPTNTPVHVAILSVRTTIPFSKLIATIDEPDVVVAGTTAGGLLLVFPERPAVAGVMAAQRVAGKLQGLCEQMVVHVAPVVVRKGPRGTTCLGTALTKAEEWNVSHDKQSVKLTPDALRVLGSLAAETKIEPPAATALSEVRISGFRESMNVPIIRPSLRGRDELISAVVLETLDGFVKGEPGLSTIVGDVGIGKTRFVEALAAAFGDHNVQACVVRTAPPEQGDVDGTSKALARYALGLEDVTSAEAIRQACVATAGSLGDSLWPGVASVFGSFSQHSPEFERLSQTPGAMRRAFSRLVGYAIGVRAADKRSVLIVDDAQWADPAALDALEIATLGSGNIAPWIVVVSSRALLTQRPAWADRAVRHPRRDLEPLSAEAMRELLRELLSPIEMIPELVLDELVQATEGVPLYAVELVYALHSTGRVRRRRSTESFFLAADELKGMSKTRLGDRLAQRALEGLPTELTLALQVASALGTEVSAAEVSSVQDILAGWAEPAPDTAMMDANVAFERLTRRGITYRISDDRHRFRHMMLREGIEEATPARFRQRIHAAALEYINSKRLDDERALVRIARHAEASGAREAAAQAYMALADMAMRRYRPLEAEASYSSALNLLEKGSFAQERAYAGRGQSRAQIERFDDAIDDLERAIELATVRGDERMMAGLLLDTATLHDLRNSYDASAAAMERASDSVLRVNDPLLSVRLDAARGRTFRRAGKIPQAIEMLTRAADLAAGLSDTRTQCEALLLLSTSLVMAGRLPEAEQRFVEVIGLTERIGDRFHYGVAHNNRIWLWIKRQEHDRAVADQRVALTVARELGNATMEAFASANVAELLYYRGAYEEALPLARRMDELLRRLHGRLPPGALVIRARIEAIAGDPAEARRLMSSTGGEDPPMFAAMRRVVEHIIDLRPDGWDVVVDELFQCAETDEAIDALAHAARVALTRGRIEDARRFITRGLAARGGPVWQRRFEMLEIALPQTGVPLTGSAEAR